MTTLRVYAQMADNVYNVPDVTGMTKNLQGWRVFNHGQGAAGATGGTSHNSGFKGCIYVSSNEVVVCYKGTGGGALIRDLLADAKLAIGLVPREASAAKNLFQKALSVFSQTLPITLVGHSLGGGLCQVVAFWYNVRFVTFNAPPMGSCIGNSSVNALKPQQMFRTLKRAYKGGEALGMNYRLKGDVVSSSRTSTVGHFGPVTTFDEPSVGDPLHAHLMTKCLDYLNRSNDGSIDPFA